MGGVGEREGGERGGERIGGRGRGGGGGVKVHSAGVAGEVDGGLEGRGGGMLWISIVLLFVSSVGLIRLS